MSVRTSLAIVLIGICVVAGAQTERAVEVRARERIEAERPHKWALIIGINDYESEDIGDLNYAVADARAVYRLVVDPERGGFSAERSKLLVDGGGLSPTRNNILQQLVSLERLAGEEDTILVYFSGHGIEDDGRPVLLPSDANFEILADTGVPVSRIERLKRLTGCRVLVAILDACHSGVHRDKAGSGMMTEAFCAPFETAEGTAIMSSTDLDQSSFEDEQAGHGAFTRFLAEALAGVADAAPHGNADGLVSVSEAHRYVANSLQAWSFARNRTQTPRLDLNTTGEIVLTLSSPTPSQPAPQPPRIEPIATTAVLRVEGAEGATIFVDGVQRGTAPCQIEEDLGPLQEKQVEVVAQLTGHRSAAARITLRRGGTAAWRPELERLTPAPVHQPEPAPQPRFTPQLPETPVAPPGPRPAIGSAPTPPQPAPAPTGNPWERPGTHAGQEMVGPAGIILVWVPGGSFVMGSTDADIQYAIDELDANGDWMDDEQPAHRVELSGFWIGKTEVTVGQWQSVMGSAPGDQAGDDHPVVNVSWEDCVEFCEKAGLELPTEAQWEYAARGPDGRRYPWGDEWEEDRLCWRKNQGPGGRTFPVGTFPVGSFPSGASWCGALDMVGNVSEWCADWYDANYYASSPARDAAGPSGGTRRVVRGGSWDHYANLCRAAIRGYYDPAGRSNSVGFRAARSCR